MDSMKRLAILVLSAAAVASAAGLSAVHNVYLLKMPKGFDQYLANRLTNDGIFQVVTDPKLADAILTDQIGEGFQAKLDELFPPPDEAKPAAEATDKSDKTPAPAKSGTADKPAKPAKGDKAKMDMAAAGDDSSDPLGMLTDTVNKLKDPSVNSTFGRAKGMLFIVDAKSKQVLWSAYALPKNTSSKELDRTASGIVSRIKRDLKGK